MPFPPFPSSLPSMADEASLKLALAQSCRILALEGQGDSILGHVSARLPGWDRFWMKAPGMGLDEAHPENLLLLDLDGRLLAGHREPHEEWPIHAAIFRTRPEVNLVVHTHPPYSNAFSARGWPLRPLSHWGSYFWPPEVPTFDEMTDLIRTMEQGQALARALGLCQAVFMLSHGIAAVGPDVEYGTLSALLLEGACRIQLMAQSSPDTPLRHSPAPESAVKRELYFPARVRAIFEWHTRQVERHFGPAWMD